MTSVLGISAFYHDSAAAIVVDGRIVAAAQEERFTRVKNDARFPSAAISYCLQEAGVSAAALDYVSFYEKPLLKFDRVLETCCAFAPRGFRSFRRTIPSWLKQNLHVTRTIERQFGGQFRKLPIFVEHHESHAASAYYPSPFEEAAILTVDGVGEWATAACGIGRGGHIELTHELHFPHSLGLLYSAFTQYCGFEVDAGEYKLMGLAPYGEPKYADLILDRLVDVKPDGSLRLDLSYFDYCHGLTMISKRFQRLFGGPPRKQGAPLDDRHADIAASIQRVTETVLLRMAEHAFALTGLRRLCLAGGVALNCVANSRILRGGPFEQLWIQPAAGDAGGALGAALLTWYQLLGHPRPVHEADHQRGSLLGPEFTTAEVRLCLDAKNAVYHVLSDEETVDARTAELLAEQKTVGWMQGRLEYGPRALGSRSILADARNPQMQQVLNRKIKFRESFRPFAPAVLSDRSDEYFDLPRGDRSPYMLLVGEVVPALRLDLSAASEARGLEKLHICRSSIPAVTHVDDSARVQTVDEARHPRFAALLRAFFQKTGCPVLINTSFNVRDEPIVCTPQDAYDCFMATDLDALVIDIFLLLKDEQPPRDQPSARVREQASPPGWFSGEEVNLLDAMSSPSVRQIKTFGRGLLAVTALLAVIALTRPVASIFPWQTAAAIAGSLVGVYALIPTLRSPMLRAWMRITYPLNWLGSQLAVAMTYYLVLSPIGMLLRLFGRDAMQRRFDPSAPTYWSPRRQPVDRTRYLRPF
jgi:carbamoyltransferase